MMNLSETNKCPVCGQENVPEYEICPRCDWQNDPVQSYNLSMRGANKMTLPEAQEAYKKGQPIQ